MYIYSVSLIITSCKIIVYHNQDTDIDIIHLSYSAFPVLLVHIYVYICVLSSIQIYYMYYFLNSYSDYEIYPSCLLFFIAIYYSLM